MGMGMASKFPKFPKVNKFSTVTEVLEYLIEVCNSILSVKNSDPHGGIVAGVIKPEEKIKMYQALINRLKSTKDKNQRARLYQDISTSVIGGNNYSFTTYFQGVNRINSLFKDVKKKMTEIDGKYSAVLSAAEIKERKLKSLNKIKATSDGQMLSHVDSEILIDSDKLNEAMNYMEYLLNNQMVSLTKLSSKANNILDKKIKISSKKIKNGDEKTNTISEEQKTKCTDYFCNSNLCRLHINFLGDYKTAMQKKLDKIKLKYEKTLGKYHSEKTRYLKIGSEIKLKEDRLDKLSSSEGKGSWSVRSEIMRLDSEIVGLKKSIGLKINESVANALESLKKKYDENTEKKKMNKCKEIIKEIDQESYKITVRMSKYEKRLRNAYTLNSVSNNERADIEAKGQAKYDKEKAQYTKFLKNKYDGYESIIDSIK